MPKKKDQALSYQDWPKLVNLVKRLAQLKEGKLSLEEQELLTMLDRNKLPACNKECRDFNNRGLAYDFDTRLIAYLTTNSVFSKEDRTLLLDVVMNYNPSKDAPLERLSVHVLKEFRKALTTPYLGLQEKVASLTNEIEKKEEYLTKLLYEVDHLMQQILQESAGKIMNSESVVIKAFDQSLPNDKIIEIIKTQNKQIIQFIKEESVKASLDPLTGVFNRGALDRHLEQVFSECKAENIPLSLLMIDIDHFKRFNDTYGHLIGDEVLKFVVQRGILKRIKGFESSFCGKYGGEEFVVALKGMNSRRAASIAETIRANLELNQFIYNATEGDDSPAGQTINETITVSIGVSEIQDGQSSPTQLLDRADKALYEAKDGGRNKVCTF